MSFGVSSVKANEEDEQMIKELQRNAAFMDPTRAAAHLVGAQASAMQSAAAHSGRGPGHGLHGMGMAGQMGGMNAQNLYQMGAQQQPSSLRLHQLPLLPPLDLFLRAGRHHGQLLPQLRQQKNRNQSRQQRAGSAPAVRRLLESSVRSAASPKPAADGLDLRLRRGEQGQVLLRVRGEKARRRAPVQVRQVRLGAG